MKEIRFIQKSYQYNVNLQSKPRPAEMQAGAFDLWSSLLTLGNRCKHHCPRLIAALEYIKIVSLYSSLCPIASIQVSISDGLGNMYRIYPLAACKVGNGTGNLQDAAIGTGGEFQAFHGHTQHVHRGSIGFSELVEHPLRHHGIAVDALEGFEANLLDLSGLDDALTNLLAGFPGFHLAQGSKRHRLNLAMDVDTVQQGTTDFVHVTLYLPWRADAVVRGVAIVATGTGVHRGYQHKRTGIFHAVLSTADADFAVFQRLAQHLKDGARQFRHLIQEEYAIVCQRNLARLGIVSSTHESHDISIRLLCGILGRYTIQI